MEVSGRRRRRRDLADGRQSKPIVPSAPRAGTELFRFGMLQHFAQAVVAQSIGQATDIGEIPIIHYLGDHSARKVHRVLSRLRPDVFAGQGKQQFPMLACSFMQKKCA